MMRKTSHLTLYYDGFFWCLSLFTKIQWFTTKAKVLCPFFFQLPVSIMLKQKLIQITKSQYNWGLVHYFSHILSPCLSTVLSAVSMAPFCYRDGELYSLAVNVPCPCQRDSWRLFLQEKGKSGFNKSFIAQKDPLPIITVQVPHNILLICQSWAAESAQRVLLLHPNKMLDAGFDVCPWHGKRTHISSSLVLLTF